MGDQTKEYTTSVIRAYSRSYTHVPPEKSRNIQQEPYYKNIGSDRAIVLSKPPVSISA